MNTLEGRESTNSKLTMKVIAGPLMPSDNVHLLESKIDEFLIVVLEVATLMLSFFKWKWQL